MNNCEGTSCAGAEAEEASGGRLGMSNPATGDRAPLPCAAACWVHFSCKINTLS